MATDDAKSTTSKTDDAKATPGQAADKDAPTGDVAADVKALHEARVSVPGAPTVDARLDNRTGADRPPLETFPAKPQHIDGPDVMHQAAHTAAALKERASAAEDRKGMFSPGPHGLSDESVRESDAADAEGQTNAEAARGSRKAG